MAYIKDTHSWMREAGICHRVATEVMDANERIGETSKLLD